MKLNRKLAMSLVLIITITAIASMTLVAASPMPVLTIKCFPPDAILSEDGKALKASSRNGLYAKYSATKGSHAFTLSAEGYKEISFSYDVVKSATVEKKLERLGSSLDLIGMVPCGPQPKSLLYSPDGKRLFVALLEGRGVDVIDTATLKKTATWTPPDSYAKKVGFVELAIHESRSELWVSQMTTGTVHIFDLMSGKYLATIALGGEWSKFILFSKDGKTAFVSNWVSKDLSVVTVKDRKKVALFKCSGTPRGMAISPDGRTLYVANFDLCAIDVFDLTTASKKTGAARITWNYGKGNMRHLVMNGDGSVLFASDMGASKIFAISTATGKILREARVGPNPNTIALNEDGSRLFVSTRGTDGAKTYIYEGPDFGTLEVFDSNSFEKMDWASGGNQPTGLAVNPSDGSIAFSDFLDARIEFYSFR